jgi:hypothetical protein
VDGIPVEVSVFEDQASYTITQAFTITNPNPASTRANPDPKADNLTYAVGCSVEGVPTSNCSNFLYGDSTDYVTGDSVAPGGSNPCAASGSGASLAAGASCTVIVTLDLPNELDYGDFGISAVTLQAAYTENVEEASRQKGDLEFGVLVKDASTPEPGSLLLLGTGMLGLAGVVRRKLSRG